MFYLVSLFFNLVCPFGIICAAIRRDSESLLSFLFLSHAQVFSGEILSDCCLKHSYFSFLLFPSFVVLLITVFVLFLGARIRLVWSFYVVFESTYWCIHAIFNAGDSSSSFSWYIESVFVISGMLGLMHRYYLSCSLVHSLKFFPRPL